MHIPSAMQRLKVAGAPSATAEASAINHMQHSKHTLLSKRAQQGSHLQQSRCSDTKATAEAALRLSAALLLCLLRVWASLRALGLQPRFQLQGVPARVV